MRFLLEEHQRPLRWSCDRVGLSRAAWYRPPPDWAVRDAEMISALAEWVKDRPARGFMEMPKAAAAPARMEPQAHPSGLQGHGIEPPPRSQAPPAKARAAVCAADAVWSADFMSDALACGRRFRTFKVEDDFNREALHSEVDTSISSLRLVRIFRRLQREHGLPQVLRTDNGPAFLGEDFTEWAKEQGMAIQYIQPGQPNQNATIERFNRTFREEVLDQYLFRRFEDVREAACWWMLEYNEQRPHDSLGDLTPAEVRQKYEESSTFDLCARGGSLRQVVRTDRLRQVVHAAPADAQGLRLLGDRQLVFAVEHRFALSSPALVSAPSKKSFSSVSSPILACSAFRSTGGSAGRPSCPNTLAALPSNCSFQSAIWLGWIANCLASSAIVFSPRMTASATLALNAGEWFQRGLLLIFAPSEQGI